MKKKTLYGWTACIVAVGILFALLLGLYTEEREMEYVYEKVGEIIYDEEELEKYGMEAKHLFYWPKMLAFGGGIRNGSQASVLLAEDAGVWRGNQCSMLWDGDSLHKVYKRTRSEDTGDGAVL